MDHADNRIRETQRLLGQAAMQLSGLDCLLERIFLLLTNLGPEIGSTIYLRDDSTARRRDLVDAVAKIAIKNEDLLSRWQAIKGEHQALFQLRNRLLHDTWAINPEEGTFALLRQYPPGKNFLFDGDYFPQVSDDALERIAIRAGKLAADLLALLSDLEAQRSGRKASE